MGWVYTYDGLGRRVRSERGGVVVNYLYSGDTVVAEGSGSDWVYYDYGSAMYARIDSRGVPAYQHWNLRGDLVAQTPLLPLHPFSGSALDVAPDSA